MKKIIAKPSSKPSLDIPSIAVTCCTYLADRSRFQRQVNELKIKTTGESIVATVRREQRLKMAEESLRQATVAIDGYSAVFHQALQTPGAASYFWCVLPDNSIWYTVATQQKPDASTYNLAAIFSDEQHKNSFIGQVLDNKGPAWIKNFLSQVPQAVVDQFAIHPAFATKIRVTLFPELNALDLKIQRALVKTEPITQMLARHFEQAVDGMQTYIERIVEKSIQNLPTALLKILLENQSLKERTEGYIKAQIKAQTTADSLSQLTQQLRQFTPNFDEEIVDQIAVIIKASAASDASSHARDILAEESLKTVLATNFEAKLEQIEPFLKHLDVNVRREIFQALETQGNWKEIQAAMNTFLANQDFIAIFLPIARCLAPATRAFDQQISDRVITDFKRLNQQDQLGFLATEDNQAILDNIPGLKGFIGYPLVQIDQRASKRIGTDDDAQSGTDESDAGVNTVSRARASSLRVAINLPTQTRTSRSLTQ